MTTRGSNGHLNFQGAVVIVTGGGQGIGQAVCQAFQKLGARVICVDIMSEAAVRPPDGIFYKELDVSRIDACRRVINEVVDAFGSIHVLVNNAAIQPPESYKSMHELDDALVERMMEVNVKGYRNMAKLVVPSMIQARHGVIVNVASVQGHRSARGCDPYGVSKAANLAQTRQWAIEYARLGIRVNSVSPGAIRTTLVLDALAEQGGEKDLANRHPMGRLGDVDEVAHAILFLCSSAASFITGADLAVDGGLSSFGAFAAPYACSSHCIQPRPVSASSLGQAMSVIGGN